MSLRTIQYLKAFGSHGCECQVMNAVLEGFLCFTRGILLFGMWVV